MSCYPRVPSYPGTRVVVPLIDCRLACMSSPLLLVPCGIVIIIPKVNQWRIGRLVDLFGHELVVQIWDRLHRHLSSL